MSAVSRVRASRVSPERTLCTIERSATIAPTPTATQMKKNSEPPPRGAQLARRHAEDEAHAAAAAGSPPAALDQAGDAAVAQRDGHVGERGQLGIVRHQHDRRLARAIDLEQQLDDLAAGLAVEVAGRLVGEEERRIVGERARDGDALLLAARELRRIVMARDRRARRRPAAHRRARAASLHAGNLHRHQHVLERRQRREQMKELEHEADPLAAQPRERVLVERRDVDAVERRRGPSDGESSPASSPSSVDLPLPDGPVIATTRPRRDGRGRADGGS